MGARAEAVRYFEMGFAGQDGWKLLCFWKSVAAGLSCFLRQNGAQRVGLRGAARCAKPRTRKNSNGNQRLRGLAGEGCDGGCRTFRRRG